MKLTIKNNSKNSVDAKALGYCFHPESMPDVDFVLSRGKQKLNYWRFIEKALSNSMLEFKLDKIQSNKKLFVRETNAMGQTYNWYSNIDAITNSVIKDKNIDLKPVPWRAGSHILIELKPKESVSFDFSLYSIKIIYKKRKIA